MTLFIEENPEWQFSISHKDTEKSHLTFSSLRKYAFAMLGTTLLNSMWSKCNLLLLTFHNGGHYWDYYNGTLSCSQVSTSHLRIRHLYMKYTGDDWFPNGWQRLDLKIGHQDSSLSNGRQGDMIHWNIEFCWTNNILHLPLLLNLMWTTAGEQ